MLLFPNCKINIGLRITEKRQDGYHNIASLFLPVPWYDALEVIESSTLTLHPSGNPIPGNATDNLCLKAWHLLKQDFEDLPPVDLYLHKSIPTGAGLGGGSSNGAFMLIALNKLFNLGLQQHQLLAYALQLGSDCPFFIRNEASLAGGRGEELSPITISLSGYTLVLINPGIHIPTPWAFKQITPTPVDIAWQTCIQQQPTEWKKLGIINDFEEAVCKAFPPVQHILQVLVQSGAAYCAMSGSGSTCFGLFEKKPAIFPENYPTEWLMKIIQL